MRVKLLKGVKAEGGVSARQAGRPRQAQRRRRTPPHQRHPLLLHSQLKYNSKYSLGGFRGFGEPGKTCPACSGRTGAAAGWCSRFPLIERMSSEACDMRHHGSKNSKTCGSVIVISPGYLYYILKFLWFVGKKRFSVAPHPCLP